MLTKLGYSKDWLNNGILTENILTEQYRKLCLGEDDKTEHYRFRTLCDYFKSKAFFDNNILRHILQLLQNDVDISMASSATILLLKNKALTDPQFDTVADFLKATFGERTIKYIDKAKKERV
jgi:hypothetical protein